MLALFESVGPTVLLLLVAAATVALGVLVHRLTSVPARAVVARKLVTGNETEFLGRLRRALPGLDVHPQVAMSALLDVNLPADHPEYWEVRRQFSMKTVDYVVTERKSQRVLAVVELDDRTHDSKRDKDAMRDALLASAGIPTLRWDSRRKPNVAEIAASIARLAKPATV